MSSLTFPDVNVWLALLMADHIHRDAAKRWWATDDSEVIGFCRLTQMAVLRLLTTTGAMNGKPLSMKKAWAAYDRLYADQRVAFVPEPSDVEAAFRKGASSDHASPKLWADAYLLAFARSTGGQLVTFDRALAERARGSILLG
ncbi:MAG: TA system VapC family ribonuclease toxin [Bryobacteraceae bacterium]|jgi:toxin-antitoxin system PIN domain toxin